MKKYRLIIFEGIDGSGKTTQAKYFTKKLNAFYFREPKFFKKEILKEIHPLTELFLFLADRSEVYSRIKNFYGLNGSKTDQYGYKINKYPHKSVQNPHKSVYIILDRSFPSTLAYQLVGRNLKKLISIDDYLEIDFLARQKIEPYLVIVFDVPVNIALKRLKKKTKFEEKKFLMKVRKAYLNLAKKFNWYVVDGTKDKNEVKKNVWLILKEKGLLKEKEI
jgi:dTMP kinase